MRCVAEQAQMDRERCVAVPLESLMKNKAWNTNLSKRRGLGAGRLCAGRNHGGDLRLQLWHLVFVNGE